MSGIFKFRAILTTLILLVLGYVALWYTVGFRTQKAATAALSGWLDQGIDVRHGKISLSGFPYRLVLEVEDLNASTRAEGLHVEADRLTLISHLWTPDHWIVQAEGAEIELADGMIAIEEDFLQASYRLHGGDRTVIKIDSAGAGDMQLKNPGGLPRLTNWSLLLGKDNSDTSPSEGLYEKRTLEFRFFAEAGQSTLEFSGGVSGPALSDWSAAELAEWRDEGGLLEIDDLNWRTPGLTLKANGDITLDGEFKPLGSASLTASDWAEVSATLRPYGVLLNRTMPEQTTLMMQNGSAMVGNAVALNLPQVVETRR